MVLMMLVWDRHGDRHGGGHMEDSLVLVNVVVDWGTDDLDRLGYHVMSGLLNGDGNSVDCWTVELQKPRIRYRKHAYMIRSSGATRT